MIPLKARLLAILLIACGGVWKAGCDFYADANLSSGIMLLVFVTVGCIASWGLVRPQAPDQPPTD